MMGIERGTKRHKTNAWIGNFRGMALMEGIFTESDHSKSLIISPFLQGGKLCRAQRWDLRCFLRWGPDHCIGCLCYWLSFRERGLISLPPTPNLQLPQLFQDSVYLLPSTESALETLALKIWLGLCAYLQIKHLLDRLNRDLIKIVTCLMGGTMSHPPVFSVVRKT